MKWLQQKRLSPHRSPVKRLSLLVAQGPLNHTDTEIRPFCSKLIFWILQILKEPVDCLLLFLVGNLFSVPDAFSVCQDLFPVLTLHSAFSASTKALVFLSVPDCTPVIFL